MMFPNLIRTVCLTWCILTVVIHAFNLNNRLEPEGPLGVRLDYNLAVSWPTPVNAKGQQIPRSFLWSTHLKFMEPVSKISDGQLWQMAHDAFDEMDADALQYAIAKDKPRGMTVLAFGNEIIISTSMKGKYRFAYAYPPSTVRKALQLCQITWEASGGAEDGTHKNSGNCGEVMAAQLYYTIHNAPLADQNARVGAVLRGNSGLTKTPPCGTNRVDEWGCNLFVSQEKLTVMDTTIAEESYVLETLAGGLDTVGQIQVCGSPTTN